MSWLILESSLSVQTTPVEPGIRFNIRMKTSRAARGFTECRENAPGLDPKVRHLIQYAVEP